MEKNKLIAVYARVSTSNQEDQKTIDAQLSEVHEHAKKNGYSIVREYLDEGWSGQPECRGRLWLGGYRPKFDQFIVARTVAQNPPGERIGNHLAAWLEFDPRISTGQKGLLARNFHFPAGISTDHDDPLTTADNGLRQDVIRDPVRSLCSRLALFESRPTVGWRCLLG